MSQSEYFFPIDKTPYHTAVSKEVVSGRNPLYYVYNLVGDINLQSNPQFPPTYTSFFPLREGSVETFVNDTATIYDDENLEDIYFKLLQISLPFDVIQEGNELFRNIPIKKLKKRQEEDYEILIKKNLPFATLAFNIDNMGGIESFNYLSFAHACSFPPTMVLNKIQQELQYSLKKKNISSHSHLYFN